MEGFKHYRSASENLDPIQHRRKYDVFFSFRGPDVRNTLANRFFHGFHVFLGERSEKGENIEISLKEPMKESPYRHRKEKIEEEWKASETVSGDEDKLVQQVAEYFQTYHIKDLLVAKHFVGLAARTIEVTEELPGNSDHQRRMTIGIWGMGGSGKTILLKSIYNHIHHSFQACCFVANSFQACCFVADIRATARESVMGLRNLQKYVLKNLTKHNVDLCIVDQGKIKMKTCLTSIRALVLLDDVECLDDLIGDWYGPGSIIIITTWDTEVLQQRQVDKIQAMGGLSLKEGVKLFSWHAFGRESPE